MNFTKPEKRNVIFLLAPKATYLHINPNRLHNQVISQLDLVKWLCFNCHLNNAFNCYFWYLLLYSLVCFLDKLSDFKISYQLVQFQVLIIREKLAELYESEQQWSKAAEMLSGIDLDSGMRSADRYVSLIFS